MLRTREVDDEDDTFAQDLGPRPPAMDQTVHHATLREVLQMLARLAETRAAHEHRADQKITVNEMIERNTRRHDIAAGVGSGELDSETLARGVDHAAEERLDGLDL